MNGACFYGHLGKYAVMNCISSHFWFWLSRSTLDTACTRTNESSRSIIWGNKGNKAFPSDTAMQNLIPLIQKVIFGSLPINKLKHSSKGYRRQVGAHACMIFGFLFSPKVTSMRSYWFRSFAWISIIDCCRRQSLHTSGHAMPPQLSAGEYG